MKRIAILVMMLSLVLSGCFFKRKTNYEFLHSADQIVSIVILAGVVIYFVRGTKLLPKKNKKAKKQKEDKKD